MRHPSSLVLIVVCVVRCLSESLWQCQSKVSIAGRQVMAKNIDLLPVMVCLQ